MKYIWLAIATLLTPFILLLAVGYLLNKPGPPPAARDTLAGYLSVHNRTVNKSESVQSMLHSSRPGGFTPAMSSVTYGSNGYFGTTYGTAGVPGDPASRPAPYPVSDLWCASLTDGGSQPRTVLLAEHEDMYVAAWVLHEPVPEADLDTVCR